MSDESLAFQDALWEGRQRTSQWVRRLLGRIDEAAQERPLSRAEEDRARAYREVLAEREESTR